jgi:FixJ family two-component response regulator
MIYLIDDDKSVRRAFELFLKSAGLEYKSFENANDFFALFSPETHDILVLDLHLPGISGIDLLEKFSRESTYLPVIVVTAFDDLSSREACRKYGVKAYLRKPVDGEALMDLIKYNLSQ